jgi:hypothetical protein
MNLKRKIVSYLAVRPFGLLFWVAALSLFSSNLVMAQSEGTLRGVVLDEANLPLEMATLSLLNPVDSALMHFAISNKSGFFVFKNVPAGVYVFQCAYIGHQTLMYPIQFDGQQTNPAVDSLVMKQETNVLSEIVIEGQRIPIIINRDTVSYNTESFNVRSDESVEDLLRRLPGIEVDARGQVLAQGEEVKKVLVDGKEFFGGNVQVVTQNLPADAVKNVKVYDRKSEDAMFTGVEDGVREKTIDLELKEDRKKGVFGDLEGGGGTDDRYRAKGSLHAFTPETRFSVMTNNNNLNQFGFNWNDMMAMAGNTSGGGFLSMSSETGNMVPMGYMAPDEGVFTASTTGFNINHDPSKKHRFNFNYFLTYFDHRLISETQSQEFNNQKVLNFNDQSRQRNLELQHRSYFEYRWEPDSANRLEVKAAVNTKDLNRRQRFQVFGTTDENVVVQEGVRFDNRLQENLEAIGIVNYIHNFRKSKRNLQTRLRFNFNEDVTLRDYEANNNFPLEALRDFLSQIRIDDMRTESQTANVTYNEPLSEKHSLNFQVAFRNSQLTQIRDVNNRNGAPIDSLSPHNIFGNQEYTVAVGHVLDLNKSQDWSLTTTINHSTYVWGLENLQIGESFGPRQQSFWRPSVSLNHTRPGRRSYLSFSRYVQVPGIFQLIDVPDLLNPLNISKGNPNLNPAVNNSFWTGINRFQPGRGTSYNLNASFTLTENPIVFAQTIDENFRRVSQAINAEDLNANFSLRGGSRFLIGPIKSFLRLNAEYGRNIFNAPVNNVNNRQINDNYTAKVELSNSKKTMFDVTASYSYNITNAQYSIFENLNQSFVTQRTGFNFIYHPTKPLTIRADFDYLFVSEEQFAGALSVPLLNGMISYQLKPKSPWTFKINAFDLLNQNLNITRIANANLIQQTETNLLTRYFLVSVLYKFKKQ